MYTVKEIFYTLQGEGANTGKAAVFCRFSGCNLWSGREEDRSRAVCQFCDTDFVGVGPDGGKFRRRHFWPRRFLLRGAEIRSPTNLSFAQAESRCFKSTRSL
jgi:Organic radical activating enzymes